MGSARPTREEKGEAMKRRFQQTIDELNMTILQCEEGIDWLNERLNASAELYDVNAMVAFVGSRARGCNLNKQGLTVHVEPPSTKMDICVFHCGEMDCSAALILMKRNKKKIKENCGKVVYLQGGALCFVEKGEPLQNFEECQGIVQPHKPGVLAEFTRDVKADKISCDLADAKLSEIKRISDGSLYVWNAMVPVFGAQAHACDISGVTTHGTAPTTENDLCVLYCGEDSCPQALSHMVAKKDDLAKHCKKLEFLEGGAKCFLEKKIALDQDEDCRKIVAPEQ